MTTFIDEALQSLEQYFIYLYPGFITICFYSFIKARKIQPNKVLIVSSIVISYVYVLIYRWITEKNIEKFQVADYIIILFIAIVVPYIWHLINRSSWIEPALNKIGINASMDDSAWGYIHHKDKNKKGIVLKIFLDDEKVMYEGSLRYRETGTEKQCAVCLSGYRRYVKEDDKFVQKLDYGDDHSRWVMIDVTKATRVEVKYNESK